MSGIHPFQIAVPQAKIDRICGRLRSATWPVEPDDSGAWQYGIDLATLRELVAHWVTDYDWRAAETRLNQWPQFVAKIDGVDVHCHRIRGDGGRLPLIMTHGWPGSTLELMATAERLALPGRFGGVSGDGRDVIIPSLPGYGFSGRPARPIGPRRVAAMWRTLMVDHLGYDRFAAQGGDWGSAVTTWLGADHGDVVTGIHLNMMASWARDTTPPECDEEARYRTALARVQAKGFAYHQVQTLEPQTVAVALTDSPLGYAAWVLDKFKRWSDAPAGLFDAFGRDDLITNMMITLVNDAAASALWLYRGRAEEAAAGAYAGLRVKVPTGVALFPKELIPYPPRAVAERTYAITHWQEMPAGGHFAAMEQPLLLARDIETFLAAL